MKCLLLLLGMLANPVFAATFVVSNTNDNGPGSLRYAISLSTTNLEEDTIVFDPIVFFARQTIVLETGELIVSPDRDLAKGIAFGLSIIGPGPEKLTLDGNRKSRIFRSERGSYRFSISGMTLTRGYAVRGGAIYAGNTLRVSDSVITDNLAAGYAEYPDPPGGAGGGIYADGFVISDTVISGNTARGILINNVQFPIGPYGTASRGGGVYGAGFFINCTLSDNVATGENGLNVNGGFGGSGGGAYGGAAFSPNQLYVINSRFVENKAIGGSGATVLDGTAGNGGEAWGGAVHASGGRIANASFIGNAARGGKGGGSNFAHLTGNGGSASGGGIYEGGGQMANITVVQNATSAGDGRKGGAASGGGIYGGSSPLNVVNATITNNTVSAGAGTDINGIGRGGGVFTEFDDVTTFTFRNNIVAANLAPEGPDLNGVFPGSKNNLIGIGQGSTAITDGVNGNLVGSAATPIDARLGPVSFNGGTTETRPLLLDSPAINSGANAVSDPWFHSAGARPLLYDQRGFQRINPVGGSIDMGAYEFGALEYPVSTSKPDLRSQSDTGNSDQDNITRSSAPSFQVTDGIPGAKVELLRDDVLVASLRYTEVATNSSVIMLTDPLPPLNGTAHYSARQILGDVTSIESNTLSVEFDNTAPTGTLNQAATQVDPTNQTTINFTAVFSERVSGPGQLSFAGSTANITNPPQIVTSSDQINFNIGVWGFHTNGGTVTANLVNFYDLAGNAGTALPSMDNSITVDNLRPTVTMNQAAGQSDPTISQPLYFDVVFSEPVIGFDGSDVLLMSSTPNLPSAVIKVEGSGSVYKVAVSNLTPSGMVRAWVLASGTQDSFGNLNFQSTFVDNSITLSLPASLSGQVIDSSDRVLRNASVSLTNSQNVTTSVLTGSLGYFSFTNIVPGTYTVRVSSRRFRFDTRQVMVNGEISNENFKGLE